MLRHITKQQVSQIVRVFKKLAIQSFQTVENFIRKIRCCRGNITGSGWQPRWEGPGYCTPAYIRSSGSTDGVKGLCDKGSNLATGIHEILRKATVIDLGFKGLY